MDYFIIIPDDNDREVRGCTFTFLCSRTWEGLRKTSDPKIRHCSDCQRKVYLAESQDELLAIAKDKGCAAVLGIERLMGSVICPD